MACGPGCDCHCCAGIDAETPVRLANPPGLPQIAYRAGRHRQFLESLTARLSSADYPELSALTTREESDATFAIFDALASSLDVLSFYVERYANESYLRTATERISVLEMARLIGYELAPGVAASTNLAFTIQEVPGAPADPVTIPVGTKVQSVPGQDETAQAFETTAATPARAEWNAIPVVASMRWAPQAGDTELWLDGVATAIGPGDAILIVGQARKTDPGDKHWDVRVVNEVEPDIEAGRTRVRWGRPLGSVFPTMGPAQVAAEMHVFRQRAALFGHNAPDPNLLGNDDANIGQRIDTTPTIWEWRDFEISSTIDIDPQNPKIVAGSWVALVSNHGGFGGPDLPGDVELYRATRAIQRSRQDFAISSKITRVLPDTTENLTASRFPIRRSLVLAQSERVATAPTPLPQPVHGDAISLARRIPELVPGQAIALSGKRQPLVVAEGANLTFVRDGGGTTQLSGGDRLFMLEPAVRLVGAAMIALTAEQLAERLGQSGATLRLRLMDRDGRAGLLTTSSANLTLGASEKEDGAVSEIAFIDIDIDAVEPGRDETLLRLSEALEHVYERATLRVNANVAPATHGETVEAILGDGDGRRPNQRFALNQSPLTHVSANTPSGRASTLEVRVNDVLWSEVATLYAAAPDARVYETFRTDDGMTTVQFGDGIEGARLPSGSTNVRARYRKGLGVGGNVAAGKITTLLSRPLGVGGASNPSPSTGGEDGETLDRARQNAPLTVLTLDRAVSIADYANLARAFAGIDKAHALWIPSGLARGVFLTIAGVDGAEVPETGKTYEALSDALATYGDPLVPVRIVNYADARFRIKAAVKVAGDREDETVLADVRAALRDAFGFARRAFGQTVSVDEVAAAAHTVAGVKAVHVARLYRAGTTPTPMPRIFATLPVASLTALPQPAELLTLSEEAIELDILP